MEITAFESLNVIWSIIDDLCIFTMVNIIIYNS